MIDIDHIDVELVRRILNDSPFGIFVIEDEKIKYVNNEVEDIFGIQADKIKGEWIKFLKEKINLESEEESDFEKIIENVKNKLESKLDVKISIFKEEKKEYFKMDIVPILDEEDENLRIVFYLDEIKEEKIRDVWSKIPDVIGHPILILDKDHKIIDVNKAGKELLEISLDDIKGKFCYELMHESEEPPEKCPFMKMIETSKMETEEMEVEALGRYFLVSCTPVLDDEGDIDFVVHICTDITEEKMAKKELKASESKYRQLFETTKNGIALTDLEANITDCNEAFLNILGYDNLDEIKGKSYKEFTPDDYHEIEDKIIKNETLIKGYSREYEKEYVNKNGEKVYVKIRGWLRKDSDGKPIGMWVLVRDITETKKAEERGEFLHSLLRHDLKNKINVIKGYHVLLEDMVDEEGQEILDKLEKVIHSSQRLIEMVRKLAKLEKVESLEEVYLNTYLVDAVYSNRDLAEEKGFTIDMEVDTFKVKGGPLLVELFSNIISNAIEHSGGNKLKIKSIEDDDTVKVRIEDNGRGIEDEYKEKILEKGYIGPDSSGTGLGLYLCKKIVDTYRGKMEIKDSDVGGACFDLTFVKV